MLYQAKQRSRGRSVYLIPAELYGDKSGHHGGAFALFVAFVPGVTRAGYRVLEVDAPEEQMGRSGRNGHSMATPRNRRVISEYLLERGFCPRSSAGAFRGSQGSRLALVSLAEQTLPGAILDGKPKMARPTDMARLKRYRGTDRSYSGWAWSTGFGLPGPCLLTAWAVPRPGASGRGC